MDKKSILVITIIIISAVILNIVVFNISKPKNKIINDTVPEGYISVFHGGSGEQLYETYIYKIQNDKPNYGFNYVNVIKTIKKSGSSEYDIKITSRGSLDWTDDVFDVASKNNAYSYVTLPNSDNTYTIDEYMKMFLMD